jgi:hypothetical protein
MSTKPDTPSDGDAFTPDASEGVESPSIGKETRKSKFGLSSLLFDNRAQGGSMDLAGVLILLVVAGTVGFVGLQVMSTVITTTGLQQGDPLYNSSESLQQSINSAWGLVGVAFIVVILAVIVVYLYGLRGGR